MWIAEVFASIQGEGQFTGVPSAFVRTSGCNLRCWFCDTPETSWRPRGEHREWQDVAREVAGLECPHVVVTGGEPMLQPGVVPLTRELRERGYVVTIETAGTVDAAVEAFGRLDILINNAGYRGSSSVVDMSTEEWRAAAAVNYDGPFYCTRAVVRDMLRRRWGRIISIGSIVGVRGNAGQSNYAASKAGGMGFTKALAKEVATRNITVNDVAPGYISTDTVDGLPEKLKSFILKNIPQGHFGEVDDVAHLVAFIASEKAKYITGQVIGVDGGLAV